MLNYCTFNYSRLENYNTIILTPIDRKKIRTTVRKKACFYEASSGQGCKETGPSGPPWGVT